MTTGPPTSCSPRRRAAGQAGEGPAAPVLQRRVDLRIKSPGGVDDSRPGRQGVVLPPARDARNLLPAHRDTGPVDAGIYAWFQRLAVQHLLSPGALRLLAKLQRPALQGARRGIRPGEASAPARSATCRSP